jgi:predicted amidohydrolase
MISEFTAACVQMRSGVDIDRNAEEAAVLVGEAVAKGASLVATPEMTNLIEAKRDAVLAKARRERDDAVVRRFSELARRHEIWLIAGSVALRAEGERLVNRSLVFGPDGAVAARYDKIHMFDVDLPGGESYRESRTYRPGSEVVTVDTARGRIGLSICYDLRFPALYRLLAQAGAELVTIPSAFTRQTGEAHWHVLLRARAIETGAYVLAPAQGGAHASGRQTYGHSLIVGPWGEVLAEAEGEGPGIILARIDLAEVARARTRIPALRHDRAFSRAATDREHAKLAS